MVLGIAFSRGIEDAFADIASFVPKLIGFLIVLLIGYFVVKMIAKIVDKALEKAGFDKAVEKGGVGKALEKSDHNASDLVSKLVFYTLFLFVLQLAFGVFGTNPVSDLLASVIAYLPKVFVAVVIIVLATAVAAAVKEVVQASLGGLSYGKSLAVGSSMAIVIVGAFAALDTLGIAKNIVTGLFYAILAIVAGSAIIAIGGGGIMPMRKRWENALAKMDEEAPKIRQEAQGSTGRIKERSEELKDKAKNATSDGSAGSTRSEGNGAVPAASTPR